SDRRHLTFRRHTSTECFKSVRAHVLHEVFGKDASARVPSAEEQYFEFLRWGDHRKTGRLSRKTNSKIPQKASLQCPQILRFVLQFLSDLFLSRKRSILPNSRRHGSL